MRLLASLASLACIIACGSPSTPTRPTAPPAPVPAPAPPPEPEFVLPAEARDTQVGKQLVWVLESLAHPDKIADAEIEKRFAPEFLAHVPAAKFREISAQLSAALPKLTLGTVTVEEGSKLVARVASGATKMRILLGLDKAGKIAGLLVQADLDKPATFEAADVMAKKLAPKVSMLVASVDDKGACTPRHALAEKEQLAIGSAFKLYVLLGLVDKVLAGKLAWDAPLPVRDDWKSLPSGMTQNEDAGTKLSVKEHAIRMISISDNTATDHVLYTVGRKDVEAALRTGGHATPALDVPFLATREMFLLKLGEPAELAAYLKLPPEKRRAHLDGLAGKTPHIMQAIGWTKPRAIEELEWFASTADLCRVMGTLRVRSQKPAAAPLLEVLSKNPGLPIDPAAWPFIGFKGGSEPGVLNLTYLLRRADDKWFFVAVTANSTTDMVDDNATSGLVGGLVDLAAKL
ncbi:MAG: serine hydrolase [Deltaproteobacteria bacterium]|nr:serine hydrolase [Deltaproteobacteria bacterium]